MSVPLAKQARTQRAVLDRLIHAQGKVVESDNLADALYGAHNDPEQKAVRTTIQLLRRHGYPIDRVSIQPNGKRTISGYRILPQKDDE